MRHCARLLDWTGNKLRPAGPGPTALRHPGLDPESSRPGLCRVERLSSAQGLGLAGFRIKSGMTESKSFNAPHRPTTTHQTIADPSSRHGKDPATCAAGSPVASNDRFTPLPDRQARRNPGGPVAISSTARSEFPRDGWRRGPLPSSCRQSGGFRQTLACRSGADRCPARSGSSPPTARAAAKA